MTPEAIPPLCLLEQCPGMFGFHSFCIGEHFLQSASFCLLKVYHQRGKDAIAYFSDENHGSDSVVEYIGPDKALRRVVKGGTTINHKQRDVLQEDRDFDCHHDWTIDG